MMPTQHVACRAALATLRRFAVVLLATQACREGPVEAAVKPVAPERSEVAVSAAVVPSGTQVNLVLTTLDASGRAVRTGGRTVVFSVSGGTSKGMVGATIDRRDGTYSAPFTGVVAGTAATVGAVIDGVPVTRPLPTIRVRPGAVSTDMSELRVTPRTVVIGQRAIIELIARDAAGNDLDTPGLPVGFSTSGGEGTGTIGSVTDEGNGHYTASFTATGVGTPLTIAAEINGKKVTTGLPKVTVARGVSAALSTLTLSSTAVSVKSGLTVTLTVRDSAGIRRTSGGDIVRFQVLGPAGGSLGTVSETADRDDGTYSAIFTATRSGDPAEIVATLNGSPVGTTTSTVTVLPASVSPQRSTVTLSTTSLPAGQSATITAVIRDANGDVVVGRSLAVQFAMGRDGTSSGIVGPTSNRGDGSYSATFTGKVAGSPVTIGATVNDSPIQMMDSVGQSHLPTLVVVPGALSADSSTLAVTPERLSVGDSAVLRLTLRDALGNRLGLGGRRVAFTRGGGAGASVGRIGVTTDHNDGTYSAHYVATATGGPDAIRATVDGSPVARTRNVSVMALCNPGPVSLASTVITVSDIDPGRAPVSRLELPSGVTTTIALEARDSRGCPVSTPLSVRFAVAGGTSTGVLGPTIDQGGGIYTATFTGHTAGSATTIAAVVEGLPITSPPVSLAVVPGDVSTHTSVLVDSLQTLHVGDTAVVTLIERDAAGNDLVARGGHLVTFSVAGDPVNARMSAARRTSSGIWIATYRATAVTSPGVPDIIRVRIDGTPITHVARVTVMP